MCTIRQIKPSSTTTIHNMFSVRKQITVCVLVTVIVQLCSNISVHAKSHPLSLIGDEPLKPQQPNTPLPPQSDSRGRPQARRRPRPRPAVGMKFPFPKVENIACIGHDLAINRKFKDERYMQQQLNCVLDKGPCDDTGKMVKRLAPDVLKGHCPSPCTMCTRRQIKRVMAEVQRKYPRQFTEMLRSFSQRS